MVRPPASAAQETASSGSNAWVTRLTRTSTPPVRYRTTSSDRLSTKAGCRLRGSSRNARRSSPPHCAQVEVVQNRREKTTGAVGTGLIQLAYRQKLRDENTPRRKLIERREPGPTGWQ